MKYLFLIVFSISSAFCYDCWTTGCQLDNWKIKMCSHNRTETGKIRCEVNGSLGYNLTCCDETDLGIGKCWETKCGVTTCAPQRGHFVNETRECPDGRKNSTCCRDIDTENETYSVATGVTVSYSILLSLATIILAGGVHISTIHHRSTKTFPA